MPRGRRWVHLLRNVLPGGVVAVTLLPAALHGQTLPSGGAYVAGSGSIATAGAATTITQAGGRGIINWQGFSIGAGGKVQFNNGSGATLNRVTGGSLSSIEGQLAATGSVYLVNPNGVVIGPGGRVVTAGSFVAATRDVTNSRFMAGGTLDFAGSSGGGASNAGSIVAQGGDVVLIGATASNTGSISAPRGTAALAAGNQVMPSAANGPAGVYVVADTAANGDATNSGLIKAAAAELAAAGGNEYALAGNRRALIQATGTATIDGQVWLTAPNGTVSVNGSATARNADGSGGTIIADGRHVAIGGSALLSASGRRGGTVLVGVAASGGVNEAQQTSIAAGARILARGRGPGSGGHIETSGKALALGQATIDAGQGGTRLVDPTDLTIDAVAAGTIEGSVNVGTSVTEQTTASGASGSGTQSTGAGDITVAAPIAWNSAAMLTLSAFNSIKVNATITNLGSGGVVLTADNNAGGTSSGGTISFAPMADVNVGGAVNLSVGSPPALNWGSPVPIQATITGDPQYIPAIYAVPTAPGARGSAAPILSSAGPLNIDTGGLVLLDNGLRGPNLATGSVVLSVPPPRRHRVPQPATPGSRWRAAAASARCRPSSARPMRPQYPQSPTASIFRAIRN